MHKVAQFDVVTSNPGLTEITSSVQKIVSGTMNGCGLCTLFVKHTSASLIIQENADLSARKDLEAWLGRLVPDNDALYTHTQEGPDDMPAHIKSMLTATSLGIPVEDGQLLLGTWQGIFLFEHRHGRHERKVALHLSWD